MVLQAVVAAATLPSPEAVAHGTAVILAIGPCTVGSQTSWRLVRSTVGLYVV